MKKSFSVFIGIDVSKFKLDVCCLLTDEKQGIHHVFDNTVKGIRVMLKWISESVVANKEEYLLPLLVPHADQCTKFSIASQPPLLRRPTNNKCTTA